LRGKVDIKVSGKTHSVDMEITTKPPKLADAKANFIYSIPAAAMAAGAEGTFWQSDMSIQNANDINANIWIYPLYAGQDNSNVEGFMELIPAKNQLMVKNLFSKYGLASSGGLLIFSNINLNIVSRTYNNQPQGTYGQFIPSFSLENAIGTNQEARIVQLQSNENYRTNIGYLNVSNKTITISAELYDDMGIKLGTNQQTLLPYSFIQVNGIFNLIGAGNVNNGYAKIISSTNGAKYFSYGSVVDNRTGDPIFIPAIKKTTRNVNIAGLNGGSYTGEITIFDSSAENSPKNAPLYLPIYYGSGSWNYYIFIPAVAHSEGAYGTMWKTDVVFHNQSYEQINFGIAFLKSSQDNSGYQTKNFNIQGNQSMLIEDIVYTEFNESGAGALLIGTNSDSLIVSSRTYNYTSNGTYGQYIFGYKGINSLGYGSKAYLPQLAKNTDFRTNIGFTNACGKTINVIVKIYEGNGQLIGNKSYSILPYSNFQENDIIGKISNKDIDNAYAIIECNTEDAKFFAYASVVDNRTGDPIFIPAK